MILSAEVFGWIHFKLRVIKLLEIYAEKCPQSAYKLIIPVLNCSQAAGKKEATRQLQQKLSHTFKNFLLKAKYPVSLKEEEFIETFEILSKYGLKKPRQEIRHYSLLLSATVLKSIEVNLLLCD